MNEDEKMFRIGAWALGAVLVLTVGLQVCYRTQDRARNRARREIVQTQQKIAVAQANFASYVRPEILRNMVVSLSPRAQVVGFNKAVAVDDLPFRDAEK